VLKVGGNVNVGSGVSVGSRAMETLSRVSVRYITPITTATTSTIPATNIGIELPGPEDAIVLPSFGHLALFSYAVSPLSS
jgi:hypothetical protein